ncbi:MAG TPA: GAF domain-containing protein [Anaerolineae bacterium]|nr:GAF domain-containing protein [Anaerolineae bacterium]
MTSATLLVVDDDRQIAEFLNDLLRQFGHRVVNAYGGQEALDVLASPEAGVVDLILLDVLLPDMSGTDVCQRVKASPATAHIPVIMVTGLDRPADKTRGLELGADDYVTKPFDPKELVARVGAMLRLRRAERELRARNRALAALNAVADTIGRAVELPDVLNTALDQVLATLDMEAGTITLTHWDGSQIPAARRWQALDLSSGVETAEQVARSGAPALLTLSVRGREHPAACVPLRSRDRVVGTLLVAGKPGIDSAGLELLGAIGSQVGGAIERGRLFDAAQRRSDDLAILNDITRAVTSSLDVDMVLARAMRSIREILRVEAGSLILADEDTGELRFRKTLNREQEMIVDTTLRPGEGLIGQAVATLDPILLNDAPSDARFAPHLDRITGVVTRGALVAPLIVKGRAIGAIEVINKLDGPFTHDDLEMLQFLAASVAVAVENARLYGELAEFTRQLERSQEQLIQAEKVAATGRLAASIAHEINNPLQAIHNCLHLVTHRKMEPEKEAYYLNLAQEEVQRLIHIVQRTLDFYRPSQGRPTLTDVNNVIESVLALANKKVEHAKVRVHRRLSPDLPKPNAVADQLTQVFLNLIVNAVEAMPGGGDLAITTLHDEGHVRVRISDTGPGLNAEEAKRIFEPFYTTKRSGTGLGLAVSYGIIQRHGGEITVDSAPGRGATFIVSLPVNRADVAAEDERPAIRV